MKIKTKLGASLVWLKNQGGYKMNYLYTLKYRGVSPGCQPSDFVRFYNDNKHTYEVLVYDRELTDDEIANYELIDLNEKHQERGHSKENKIKYIKAISDINVTSIMKDSDRGNMYRGKVSDKKLDQYIDNIKERIAEAEEHLK